MDQKKAGDPKDKVQRRTISRNSFWALSIAFFALVGVFLFLRSPYFSVKHYVISGANRVSHAEIIARCSQKSANIFDFDLDKAQRTVKSSPWIAEAHCTRVLPDTIAIEIVERIPIVFAPVGNKMWLIDGQGRVLQEDDGISNDLIAFTGIEGVLAAGQIIETQYSWGLEVFMQLGPKSKHKLIEINMENEECILIFEDGCKVFIGKEKTGLGEQIILLESIITELDEDGSHAEYIDLRFDKHAVKLKL